MQVTVQVTVSDDFEGLLPAVTWDLAPTILHRGNEPNVAPKIVFYEKAPRVNRNFHQRPRFRRASIRTLVRHFRSGARWGPLRAGLLSDTRLR